MNPSKPKQAKPARDWRVLIQTQISSGQSAADFCREQGIAYTTFLYHRDRLKKANPPKTNPPPSANSAKAVSITPPGAFVPITVEGNPHGQTRLCFPGGLIVESSVLPSSTWILEIAQRLQSQEVSPC